MSAPGPNLADDLSYCATITRGGGSNLWFVSKLLPEAKRGLFTAAYASMRYIDDLIDDEFLALSPEQRSRHRPRYHKALNCWLSKTTGEVPLSGEQEDALYRALSATIGQCDLGPQPWIGLADAMRRDIDELVLQDWSEFDEYSTGATVSPAVVYLYILLAEQDNTGRFSGPDVNWLYDHARDMAIFCYLVHIMRDISKDSKGCAQLLTIPVDLRNALLRHDIDGAQLISAIGKKAENHRENMAPFVEELTGMMKWRERQAFQALLGIYEKLFKKISDNPDTVFSMSPQDMDTECREADLT